MKDRNYIYTVYEEKSFSKAAKKLFVSQPALSLAVKKEEEELGITIFDRSASPLTLTEEGKVYIEALEEIRSVERSLSDRLTDMADLRSGHVIVSGENFVSSFILPEILMRFSNRYSGIDVELVESNSPQLRRQLLSESIDLLVAHDFDPDAYEAIELFEENVLLALPKDSPLNLGLEESALTTEEIRAGLLLTKPAIDLSKFSEVDFLLLKPGNDIYKRASLICKEAGFEPKARIRLDQLITAYNLACAGMGATFVSDILVEKSSGSGCLFYRLDSQFAHRKMSIGYKRNRYLTRAVKAFIQEAMDTYSARKG